VRRPEEQAICAFVLRAIARSGRHSMLMSIYSGGGARADDHRVLPDLIRFGSSALGEPRVPTLALPLILSAALAVGVRIIITIPAEMGARWIFQTAGDCAARADAAATRRMLLVVRAAGRSHGRRLGACCGIGRLAVTALPPTAVRSVSCCASCCWRATRAFR
jgi:hypothetical protein